MTCKTCGEFMSGDGHTIVLHCPNAEWDDYIYDEPDAQPVHCSEHSYKNNWEDETPSEQRKGGKV